LPLRLLLDVPRVRRGASFLGFWSAGRFDPA
jgi:hypothetical protein